MQVGNGKRWRGMITLVYTHAPYLEDNASQRVRRSTEHSPYSLSVCGEREEVKNLRKCHKFHEFAKHNNMI